MTHYLNIKKFSYIKSYHADWKHNVQKEEAAEVFDMNQSTGDLEMNKE